MEQKRSHATGNVMSLLTSAHTQQLLLFTTRVHGMLRQSICALASSYFSESSSAQDRKFERSIENRFCRCGTDRTKREAKINASNATQNSNCSFTMKTTLTLLVVLCIDRTQAARETVACHDDASCEDKINQKDSNLAITTNFNYFVHRCSQGGHVPQISSILCHFVLWDAVSQTKYYCSLKVKTFGIQNFGLATLLILSKYSLNTFSKNQNCGFLGMDLRPYVIPVSLESLYSYGLKMQKKLCLKEIVFSNVSK